MPDFVVPAFVSTFAPLIPAVTSSTNTAAMTPLSLSGISSLVQTSILHQLFVVSPGFSPVPAKLVSQVMAGKFVELNELLSANLVLNEPRASIAVLVLTPTPKNLKWWVDDITSWLEAFSVYCLIYPPISRITGKICCNISCLSSRLTTNSLVWLSNDWAFCKHAAVTNLTDWSTSNLQLFNFHAAGASVYSGRELSDELTEPRGASSLLIICRSWNGGHCVAPSLSRHFTHKCSSCFGPHCIGACPVESPSQCHPSAKRRVNVSPPRSSSKSRH